MRDHTFTLSSAVALSCLWAEWSVSGAVPPPVEDRPAIALADLSFNDGAVRSLFHKLDAAAKALARPGWTVQPYRNQTYRGGPANYVAQWCEVAPKGECNCAAREPIPNHYVQLNGTGLALGGKQIDGLQLFAGYIPKKGWGARLEYRTHNGQAPIGEMFSLVFFHDDFNRMRDGGQGTWALELGNSYFTATKRQGDFSYYYQVSMYGDPKTWMGDTRTPRERDVERCLTSPKGFLDSALAELDALEGNLRKHIPAGTALRTVTSYKDVRSDFPPKEVKLAPENQPSQEQLAALLEEALVDVQQRRTILRTHYREMFAAARMAFPLAECMGYKVK